MKIESFKRGTIAITNVILCICAQSIEFDLWTIQKYRKCFFLFFFSFLYKKKNKKSSLVIHYYKIQYFCIKKQKFMSLQSDTKTRKTKART